MKVDSELSKEICVSNGLRQGCTMAPTLFNLYSCVVAERWLDRVKEEEGVGTVLMYIRWISNSSEDLPVMRVM